MQLHQLAKARFNELLNCKASRKQCSMPLPDDCAGVLPQDLAIFGEHPHHAASA
jgi:hypothetical protein